MDTNESDDYSQQLPPLSKYNLSNLMQEVQKQLLCKARKQTYFKLPLYLQTSFENGDLYFSDDCQKKFKVDQKYLYSFKETYSHPAFHLISLSDWQIEIQFDNKYCTALSVSSSSLTFQAQRSVFRTISDCYVKIPVICSKQEVKSLNQNCRGYLLRIGKYKICQQSFNINKQFKSLFSFIPTPPPKQVSRFEFTPFQQKQVLISPISTLNSKGIEALERARHFVKKQEIYEFMRNEELSREAIKALEDLLANRKQERKGQFVKQDGRKSID